MIVDLETSVSQRLDSTMGGDVVLLDNEYYLATVETDAYDNIQLVRLDDGDIVWIKQETEVVLVSAKVVRA